MSKFHDILANEWSHRELCSLRQEIVDWHSRKWRGSKYDLRFAVLWRTGEFDGLEIQCEELVRKR